MLLAAVAARPIAARADAAAPSGQKTFATPADAVAALLAAVKVHDKAALKEIFGPEIKDILTGDDKQDKANSAKFAAAIQERAESVSERDGNVILEIGANKWPFPIPLVQEHSAWRFDTAAGKEEIVNRHIGKDELHAIGFLRAYVDARAAGRILELPKAFHGYVFRLLDRQSDAAPGGRMDYAKNSPDGGFAVVAYPEHWGKSGVMTFIAGRDGVVLQRDFEEDTRTSAAALSVYDPDANWTPVKDRGVVER